MSVLYKCPFCDSKIHCEKNNFYEYQCPVCTTVRFSEFGLNIEDLSQTDKIKLRYYFKTRKTKETVLERSNYNEIIESIPYPKSLLDKISLVLNYIYDKTTYLNQDIFLRSAEDYVVFFCINKIELLKIISYLSQQAYILADSIIDSVGFGNVQITPLGIKHIEELELYKTNSKQCFVAMWFDNETKEAWSEAIKPAIKESGYTEIRIDEVEHTDDINDRIISEIRQSKFMIVDLTGYRGGVYFEAGFAYGLGLTVIYTCKEDQLENVHFDLKHRNMILWTTDKLGEFKDKLVKRIGAVII